MAMAVIGFHAPHEQYPPSELLDHVLLAEHHGFQAAMCPDHFHPWMPAQGHSGFAWSWLGAALHATRLPFGVVNAPGQRYHPAVVAQAAMTLVEMFPGRFWLGLGSGEALNEHITGEPWPDMATRNERLRQSAETIRALWRGERVTHDGLVRVADARLYTRAERPPLILGAALTEETAEWVGGWADGLLTAGTSVDALEKNVAAFHRGGGEGKRLVLQAALSWADTEEAALERAWRRWRQAGLAPEQLSDLSTPEAFDAAAAGVRRDDLRERLQISASLDDHRARLQQIVDLGFDEIYLYQVGGDLPRFIEAFGREVLPRLRMI
jgi:coenzyme F420-dependent glucose-6-phosphate dehydrogenase